MDHLTSTNGTNVDVIDEDADYECDIDQSPTMKLIIISLGAVFAAIGTGFNALLLVVFTTRRRYVPSLYFRALALLDLLICLTYIWMFVLTKFSSKLRLAILYHIVWSANVYVYTLARITQFAIPYVIIASTAERLHYLKGRLEKWNTKRPKFCGINVDGIVVTTLLLTIAALRLPTLWAMELTSNSEQCDYYESMYLSFTEFTSYKLYKRFEITVNFMHVIASFLILTVLNMMIICRLHQYHKDVRRRSAMLASFLNLGRHQMALSHESNATHQFVRVLATLNYSGTSERERLRNAVQTSLVIISVYLACNALHFCLFIAEQFTPAWLLNDAGDDYNQAYVVLGDVVSIMFVISSTARLIIYYIFNSEIRQQILYVCTNWCGKKHEDTVRGTMKMNEKCQTALIESNGTNTDM